MDGTVTTELASGSVGLLNVFVIALVTMRPGVVMKAVVETTGDGDGGCGCPGGDGAPDIEAVGDSGGIGRLGETVTVDDTKVMVEMRTTLPEVDVNTDVVTMSEGVDIDNAVLEAPGSGGMLEPYEGSEDKTSGSVELLVIRPLVVRPLERLGGLILFSHSVVPLTTE